MQDGETAGSREVVVVDHLSSAAGRAVGACAAPVCRSALASRPSRSRRQPAPPLAVPPSTTVSVAVSAMALDVWSEGACGRDRDVGAVSERDAGATHRQHAFADREGADGAAGAGGRQAAAAGFDRG